MKSLKERVKEKIKAKAEGKSPIEPTHEADPLEIKDDPEEGDFFGGMVTQEQSLEGKLPDEEGASTPQKKEKEPTNLEAIQGTDDEAPPVEAAKSKEPVIGKEELETKTLESAESGTTEPSGTKKTIATPTQTGKYKIKTVYGDEELDVEEMAKGYMRNAHYTQVETSVRKREKMVTNLLQNPEKLVQFAMDNGVDLKPLVSPEPIIKPITLPPLPEYATDEQKAERKLMESILEQNNKIASEFSARKESERRSRKEERNNTVKEHFKALKGDLPDVTEAAVYAIYLRGQQMFGEDYGVKDAIADYHISEGDLSERAFKTEKGKSFIAQKVKEGITEYLSKKKSQADDHLAPDSLTTPPVKVPQKKEKYNTFEDWKNAAKRSIGIKET